MMEENLPLKGRRALVCGGSRGLGFSSAVKLAQMGAACTLIAKNQERLEKATQDLPRLHEEQFHDFISCDLQERDRLRELIILKQHQLGPHTVVIHNSGGPKPGTLMDCQEGDFFTAFESHLFPAQMITRLLLPGMKEQRFGRIVNILSISLKMPLPGMALSNVLRGAMGAWAKTLANELAPSGITVNSVLPGGIKTDRLMELFAHEGQQKGRGIESIEWEWAKQVPMKRLGTPEELGELVGFLCHPKASYITGTSIPVDGGRLPTI